MLVFVLCACAAFGSLPLARPAGRVWQGLPLAVLSTLLGLMLGSPAASNRPGLFWLLATWLAASVGVAGWSLLLLPQTPLAGAVQTAALLLPFTVVGLAASASGTVELARAAAASGAGPLSRARLLASALWPGALRASLVIFVLSALLASGP